MHKTIIVSQQTELILLVDSSRNNPHSRSIFIACTIFFFSRSINHEESNTQDGLEVKLLVNELCWIVSSATVINCFRHAGCFKWATHWWNEEKDTSEQDLGDSANALNDIKHRFLMRPFQTFPNFYHNLTVTADLVSLKFVVRLVMN